ncbi:hypothetical protein B0H10DRAFT_1937606 [Mycena sp. CBHHK59/15]|nr:hypothetical protein B0H10DRAFT_1937606 [Mycena sp. CBHHK59/15]
MWQPFLPPFISPPSWCMMRAAHGKAAHEPRALQDGLSRAYPGAVERKGTLRGWIYSTCDEARVLVERKRKGETKRVDQGQSGPDRSLKNIQDLKGRSLRKRDGLEASCVLSTCIDGKAAASLLQDGSFGQLAQKEQKRFKALGTRETGGKTGRDAEGGVGKMEGESKLVTNHLMLLPNHTIGVATWAPHQMIIKAESE